MIDEYLDKLPKKKTKKNYLTKVISYVLPFLTGISITQVSQTYEAVHSYLPIILLLVGYFSILPATMIFSNKMSGYVLEKHWLGICFKKYAIFKLKNQIIQELMESNNPSYTTYH